MQNAIDPTVFAYDAQIRASYRQELNIGESEFVVGFVGRLSKQKNCFRLLDIFSEILKIKEATLLVIGDGEDRAALTEYSKKLAIESRVLFLGLRNDIGKIMSTMDCFLLPSLYEGMPVVTMEAQAADLPCILSTNVPSPDLLGKLYKISLEESDAVWARTIAELPSEERQNVTQQITEAGYNINREARRWEALYLN